MNCPKEEVKVILGLLKGAPEMGLCGGSRDVQCRWEQQGPGGGCSRDRRTSDMFE